MPTKRKKHGKRYRLNKRDRELVELVLTNFEVEYTGAVVTARERYREAPLLPGTIEQIEYFRKALSVIKLLRSRVSQHIPLLKNHPDYVTPEITFEG